MIQPFLRHKISAVVKKAVKKCQCRCISAASRTEEASHSTSIEPKKSFYRRPLPDTCVAFSSKQGRFLLAQALQENSLKSYFPLAENFITQSEPAFCGLGSLAMCFNALGMDPGRNWKGVWRWYDEAMLECCTSLNSYQDDGMSFDDYGDLSRCNGCNTLQWRADESNLEHFRSIVQQVTQEDSSSADQTLRLLTISYQRRILNQTGDGHFSPVGAYVPSEDMVLVMDVARFKYPPHWVPLELLWEAMLSINEWNGRSRGYFLLSSANTSNSSSARVCTQNKQKNGHEGNHLR